MPLNLKAASTVAVSLLTCHISPTCSKARAQRIDWMYDTPQARMNAEDYLKGKEFKEDDKKTDVHQV